MIDQEHMMIIVMVVSSPAFGLFVRANPIYICVVEGKETDWCRTVIRHVANSCSNTIVVIHNAGVRLVDQFIDHPNVTGVLFGHLPGK